MSKHQMKNVASMSIDYLTATSRSAQAAELMRDLGTRAVHQEERLGHIKHDVNFHGYKGVRAGGAMWGLHDNGQFLVQWSGPTADAWAKGLGGQEVNITRIDLQMTFKVKKPSGDFGLQQANGANAKRKELGGKHWPKLLHINAYGQGDTVYVGSRQSEKYGRLYDKGRQSKDKLLADCWRAEVEYKGETAMRVWRLLVNGAFAPLLAYSIVETQFRDWQFSLPVFQGADVYVLGNGRNNTELEQKLNWLKQQVFPTMQLLCDAGYREPVMQLMLDLE